MARSGRRRKTHSADKPMTVAEVIDAVAKGRIGHADAMRRLRVETYHDLVATVHANGRLMWAHTPVKPDPKTMAMLARAIRPELLAGARRKENKS